MSWLRKSLGMLALTVTATSVATGCEDNESMLFIVGVLNVDRTDCIARPEQDGVLLSGGVLDRLLRPSYRAALLIGSQLTQRGSRDQLRTESARFALQGAEVTLTTFDGVPIGSPYSTIGTGFVNPAGGEEAGYGVMFVDIVPASIDLPDDTIVSKVRVFGTTLGGAELESNEYIFPITVCRGCLIYYPVSAADDTNPNPNSFLCQTVSDGTDAIELEACFPGQDTGVPCNFCSASNPACADPCQNCAVRETYPPCANTVEPIHCE